MIYMYLFLLSLPLSVSAKEAQSGQWKGTIFDLKVNRVCSGSLVVEEKKGQLNICFKTDCRENGGGNAVEKWTVDVSGEELLKEKKRIGFLRGRRIILEDRYPLNNDYTFEFSKDFKKMDLQTSSAQGHFKGSMAATNEKIACDN